MLDALAKFVGGDGADAIAEWLESRESRRQSDLVSLFGPVQPRYECNCGGCHDVKETPPRDRGNRVHVWMRGLSEMPVNVKRIGERWDCPYHCYGCLVPRFIFRP